MEIAKRILKRNLGHLTARVVFAVPFGELDRIEEAQAEAVEILLCGPQYSPEVMTQRMPRTDQKSLNRYIKGLRQAGSE